MNIIAIITAINLSSELFGKHMAKIRTLNINMSLKNAIIFLFYLIKIIILLRLCCRPIHYYISPIFLRNIATSIYFERDALGYQVYPNVFNFKYTPFFFDFANYCITIVAETITLLVSVLKSLQLRTTSILFNKVWSPFSYTNCFNVSISFIFCD